MRRYLFLILISFVIGAGINVQAQDEQGIQQPGKMQVGKKAQHAKPSTEQMLEIRVQHMAKELMLSDETAAKFKPLYTDYLNELRKLYRVDEKLADGQKDATAGKKEVTDADIEKEFKEYFETVRKRIDIQETYYKKFKKILSPRQIRKIIKIEKRDQKRFQKFKDGRHAGMDRFSPKQRRSDPQLRGNGKRLMGQRDAEQKKMQAMKRSVPMTLKQTDATE